MKFWRMPKSPPQILQRAGMEDVAHQHPGIQKFGGVDTHHVGKGHDLCRASRISPTEILAQVCFLPKL